MNRPEPGARAWTHAIPQYPLPEGCPDREEVTVVSCEERKVTIRHADGRTWTLDHWNVDAGRSYKIGDTWVPETHPEVVASLRAAIAENLRTPWQRAIDNLRESTIADARWILARNGLSE